MGFTIIYYGICATQRGPSVTAPLQLRHSFRKSSVTAPWQLRYSSDAPPFIAPPLQLLYSLWLRCSFRYSIATAGRAPLQPSDTAQLQLRDKSVTAPLLSFTVSVTNPVTGEHFLQRMVEPRPKFRVGSSV